MDGLARALLWTPDQHYKCLFLLGMVNSRTSSKKELVNGCELKCREYTSFVAQSHSEIDPYSIIIITLVLTLMLTPMLMIYHASGILLHGLPLCMWEFPTVDILANSLVRVLLFICDHYYRCAFVLRLVNARLS